MLRYFYFVCGFAVLTLAQAQPLTPIADIQGKGTVSPLEGAVVTTRGVVVADFQGRDALSGFFIQALTPDDDPATSDSLFIHERDLAVAVGDVVEVSGLVKEFRGLTELTDIRRLKVQQRGHTVTPLEVRWPPEDPEALEGTLIAIQHPMLIVQNYFLGRFGQFTLAAPDSSGELSRLYQPTQLVRPNDPRAEQLAQDNARRILILDDAHEISLFGDNPDPVPFMGNHPNTPSSQSTAANTQSLRQGDEVRGLVGVLDQGRINVVSREPVLAYRLHPTQAPTFISRNPRPAAPSPTDGTMAVASFNVLNYYNSFQSCFGPDPSPKANCRGANNALEFDRQRQKIVQALLALDADVIGLMEIENDYDKGPQSAVADLVAGLNEALGADVYTYVRPPNNRVLGPDTIAVGFIYNHTTTAEVGVAATIDTGAFGPFELLDGSEVARNRQPLLQTFALKDASPENGVSVVVNHFKSKGRPCDTNAPTSPAPQDLFGPLQANCNQTRTVASQDLLAWIKTHPSGVETPYTLIIGDLNAYAQEDPIITLVAGLDGNLGTEDDWVNTTETAPRETVYSFTFDGMLGTLDHAIASPALAPHITGVTVWHINTDEPSVIDYQTEFRSEAQQQLLYAGDVYRSSDHDPILIGLTLP